MIFEMHRAKKYRYVSFGDETFVLRHPVNKTTVAAIGETRVNATKGCSKSGATVWLAAEVEFTANRPNPSETSEIGLRLLEPYVIVEMSSTTATFEAKKKIGKCHLARTDSGWQNTESMQH